MDVRLPPRSSKSSTSSLSSGSSGLSGIASPMMGSPHTRRLKDVKKDLKKAKHFRESLERSRENSISRSITPSPITHKVSQVGPLSITIKPSLGYRKGWKIMLDSGEKIEDTDLLRKVVDMIRCLEFSGKPVPEKITI